MSSKITRDECLEIVSDAIRDLNANKKYKELFGAMRLLSDIEGFETEKVDKSEIKITILPLPSQPSK